jgi:hypothetical protein
MKPAVLSVTIVGSLALASMASFVVSPSSPVSMSSAVSTAVKPPPEPLASAKKSAVAVPETGRLPVPIARPPNDQAQTPPAAAPGGEPPAFAPPATFSPDSTPSADDKPLTDQQLRSALASLPRGPDIRYWIVPLADGRVKVVAGTKGDPGPEGWADKSAKHRRN